MTATDNIFTAQSLTKTYVSGEVKVHALRGVDFDISAGEVIVLLGPSGSGKSSSTSWAGSTMPPAVGCSSDSLS